MIENGPQSSPGAAVSQELRLRLRTVWQLAGGHCWYRLPVFNELAVERMVMMWEGVENRHGRTCTGFFCIRGNALETGCSRLITGDASRYIGDWRHWAEVADWHVCRPVYWYRCGKWAVFL